MEPILKKFAEDCREILQQGHGREDLVQIRDKLQDVLKNPEFLEKHFGADRSSEREILFEDPQLKFCILAHVYQGPKTGQPHDHGPTWAIYGQAAGETEMTEYKILTSPSKEQAGRVEKVKNYVLRPGMAEVYTTGQVHAPKREDQTRLVRLEGQNLAGVKRDPFLLAEV